MNAKRVYVHRSRMRRGRRRPLRATRRRSSSATASTRAPRWGRCTRPCRRRSLRRSSRRRRMPAPTCCEFGELPGGELEGGNFLRPAIVVEPGPDAARGDPGAVRPGHPDHPVRHRGGGDRGWRTTPGAASAARSGRPTPTRRTASAASWSAATSGSTTTARRASTFARPSAA